MQASGLPLALVIKILFGVPKVATSVMEMVT